MTFEEYRFGGWGSGKTFPTVVPKRGQTGFFCDSWNKKPLALISPVTLLAPSRKNNGPIHNLLSTLRSHYEAPQLPPSLPSPDPFISISMGRITLSLNLGVGAPRRRKIEDLNGCLNPLDLRNYLSRARVWEVKINFDEAESKRTPGLGYCGFIAMDRIIYGMDRSIGPDVTNGSVKLHDIIKVLKDNSSLPLRNNWIDIIPSLRSARELIASTDRYIKRIDLTGWR